jgi:hypothetical protein
MLPDSSRRFRAPVAVYRGEALKLGSLRPLILSPLHKISLHQHQVQAETGDHARASQRVRSCPGCQDAPPEHFSDRDIRSASIRVLWVGSRGSISPEALSDDRSDQTDP